MGLIHAKIALRNALDSRLAAYEADALVDTGALLLRIPNIPSAVVKRVAARSVSERPRS